MWKIKFQKAEILIVAFIVLGSFFIISRYQNLTGDFQQYGSEVLTNHQTILNARIQQRLPDSIAVNNDLHFYFFGDLMIDRHVGEQLAGKPLSLLFSNFGDDYFWQTGDIVGVNLEGAVTDEGKHLPPQNAYDFAFAPERIAELKSYGFNYFNSANNHFTDQGLQGVEETRNNLDKLGVYHGGAADAIIDDNSLTEVNVNGQKVALIGFSMVYKNFDLTKAKSLVTEAQLNSELVIINIHWGTEYEHQFSKHQQTIAHHLIDAGADVIIGHHPHVVQGMEIYQSKPIFYSLGNFIFDQYFSEDTQEGLSVGLSFGQTTTIFLYPLKSEKAYPRLMTKDEQNKFFKKFISWSIIKSEEEAKIKDGRLELLSTVID